VGWGERVKKINGMKMGIIAGDFVEVGE